MLTGGIPGRLEGGIEVGRVTDANEGVNQPRSRTNGTTGLHDGPTNLRGGGVVERDDHVSSSRPAPDEPVAGDHLVSLRRSPTTGRIFARGVLDSAQKSSTGSRIFQANSTSSCWGNSGGSPKRTSRMSLS